MERLCIIMIALLSVFSLTFVPVDCVDPSSPCKNGGTFVVGTNKCICASGFSGSICEFPFCNRTKLYEPKSVVRPVVLAYHYHYDLCPSNTSVTVDSHVKSLQVDHSFIANSTVDVVIEDANGNDFTDFTTISTEGGISVVIGSSLIPGEWHFVWNISPSPQGCKVNISGTSDLDFDIGFTYSIQGDVAEQIYTDATGYLVANPIGLTKPGTVGDMISKSYLVSTTMTSFGNVAERIGCQYQYVFGPIYPCYPYFVYWLKISGTDENNFTFTRTFERRCEKAIITTQITTETTNSPTTTHTTQTTTTTTKDPFICYNGGTHVIGTNICTCSSGYEGDLCQYPSCNNTKEEIKDNKAWAMVMLEYHYEYDNCHSTSEQTVDSHTSSLQVSYRSLTKNQIVTVAITDPTGSAFTDYRSEPITSGISLFIDYPKVGKWQFSWTVSPYGGGCEVQYWGTSDLYFDVGFTNSLQSDDPQDAYTERTDYMIVHGYNLAISSVDLLTAKSYSQSTTITTYGNVIERKCIYQYAFGPIAQCYKNMVYWLQITGVDDNNFPFSRVYMKSCQSAETTTTSQTTTTITSTTSQPSSAECDMGDKPVVPTYDVSRKSLAFVVDTTITMAQDRKQIALMFAQLSPLDQFYNFVLVNFNDPVFFSQAEMLDALNHLANGNFSDGRDCADYSLDGMFAAVYLAQPGSPIFVFTDSSSKDPDKQYKVLKQMRMQQSQLFFILTGDCCGDCKMYEAIAEASMGRVYHMAKPEIANISTLITSMGANSSILSIDTVMSCSSDDIRSRFFIDESMAPEFYFSVTGTNPTVSVLLNFNTPQPYNLLGKAGINHFYSVPNAAMGFYGIQIRSNDVCFIEVWGRTSKQIQLGFVQSVNSDSETDFPLAGAGFYYPTLHAVGFESDDIITDVDITKQNVNLYNSVNTEDRSNCQYEVLVPNPFNCSSVGHNYRTKVTGLLTSGTTFQRYASFSCVDRDIVCQNGGTSYFGRCVCANGYGGTNCEIRTTSTAYVTSTTITQPSTMPETTPVATETSTSALQTTFSPTTSASTQTTETTTSPTTILTTVPTTTSTSSAQTTSTTVGGTSTVPTTTSGFTTLTSATSATTTFVPTSLQSSSDSSTAETTTTEPSANETTGETEIIHSTQAMTTLTSIGCRFTVNSCAILGAIACAAKFF